MTTIKIHSAILTKTATGQRNAKLFAFARKKLLPHENVLVAVNSESQVASSSQLVGTKPWNVFASSTLTLNEIVKLEVSDNYVSKAIFDGLKTDFDDFKSEYEKDVTLLSKQLIRNAATQILKAALDPQFRESVSTFYHELHRKSDPRLVSVAENYLPQETTTRAFASIADAVISRRNGTIHYDSLPSLDEAVSEARIFIVKHPQLVLAYRQECGVIENYEVIKAAFNF